MADIIPFNVTNLAANAVVNSDAAVNASRWNPVPRLRKAKLYVVINAANGVNFRAGAGGIDHIDDAPGFFDANLALSTRDHLLGDFWVRPGEKFHVGYRETGGVATTDIQGMIVLE